MNSRFFPWPTWGGGLCLPLFLLLLLMLLLLLLLHWGGAYGLLLQVPVLLGSLLPFPLIVLLCSFLLLRCPLQLGCKLMFPSPAQWRPGLVLPMELLLIFPLLLRLLLLFQEQEVLLPVQVL